MFSSSIHKGKRKTEQKREEKISPGNEIDLNGKEGGNGLTSSCKRNPMNSQSEEVQRDELEVQHLL